jgi:flagellar motor switch/type III secretory pathway protein FliN
MVKLHSTCDLVQLDSVPISVSVRVCRRKLTVAELLNWVPGTILSFDEPAMSRLTLCVGDLDLGEGDCVRTGPKIGIRLARVGS